MITWILFVIIISWVIFKRTRDDGKVIGQPLGMPRGTVRAIITIMIVSFPFTYLLIGERIPGLIINAIFIVVAFYFEARKPSENRLKRIIKEIKNPEKIEIEEAREKKPLYLPKYSVRISLLTLLTLVIIFHAIGPQFPFESTNTLIDLMVIIGLYMIGGVFRGIGVKREKKKLKSEVVKMKGYENLSKFEIIEKIMAEPPSWWKKKSKSILSLTMLTCVITALFCYTMQWDYTILKLSSFYSLSLRETLLLVISVYYGFRD